MAISDSYSTSVSLVRSAWTRSGTARLAAQNSHRARGIGAGLHAGAAADQRPSAAITSGRAVTYGSTIWSLVSVNLPLMLPPTRLMEAPKPVCT